MKLVFRVSVDAELFLFGVPLHVQIVLFPGIVGDVAVESVTNGRFLNA